MLTPPCRRHRLQPRASPPRVLETYCVSDSVYKTDTEATDREPQRSGRLVDFVRSQLERARAAALQNTLPGQARDRIAHLSKLRFCLQELVPLLRFLSGTRSAVLSLERVSLQFCELEQRALSLRPSIQQFSPPDLPLPMLVKCFRVPCVIVGNVVVPLRATLPGTSSRLQVRVAGVHYRWCVEAAQTVAEHFKAFEHAVTLHSRAQMEVSAALNCEIRDVLRRIDGVLQWYRPRRNGVYEIVYEDAQYQLQHNRGHWVLVRGPLAKRIGVGRVWVGLQIKGDTRQQMLTAVPGRATSPEQFWTPQGTPHVKGICLGQQQQFAHLSSPALSDAEVLLRRLDAGVILATQRSELHRQLRAGGGQRTAQEQVLEIMSRAKRSIRSRV